MTNNGILTGVTTTSDAKVDNKNPDATMTDAEGKEITHKVTFDANGHGTAPEAQMVAYGKIAAKPADPQDDTYTMRGWYKDAECTTAWDFEKDVVTGDVTIYAKWSLKTEFEATWKTEDGKDAFGSLEEAVAAGGKDIHKLPLPFVLMQYLQEGQQLNPLLLLHNLLSKNILMHSLKLVIIRLLHEVLFHQLQQLRNSHHDHLINL